MGLRDRLRSAAKRAVNREADAPKAAPKSAAPKKAPTTPTFKRTGDHRTDLVTENRLKAARTREERRERKEAKEAAQEAERLELRQQETARKAEAARAKQELLKAEAASALAAQAAAKAATEEGDALAVEYVVSVYHPDEGIDATFPCEEGEVILDAAARAGVELPQSCLNGGCFACAGRLEDGTVDMSEDQYVMEQAKIDEGYYLLCCSTVTSDVRILTHQESQCSI